MKKSIIFLVIVFFSLSLLLVLFNKEIEKRLPWRVQRFARFLEKGSILDIRMCLCLPDEDVRLKREDGLKVMGSLYGIGSNKKKPAIILLHGNTPYGRKLAMYKVLADRFSQKGYVVLTIDFTGFGESDDPFQLNTPEALNSDKDVFSAVSYLKSLESVEKDRIFIIGHSGGAESAFSVGIQEADLQKIVAIGPPRRSSERSNDTADVEYFWNRAQRSREKVYKKQFPSWFTKEMWVELSSSDIMQYVPYFSRPRHKAIFLIDGALESRADMEYLHSYYDLLTEPKKYMTIQNSDHYFNTMEALGVCIYDGNVINMAVEEIDRWFKT